MRRVKLPLGTVVLDPTGPALTEDDRRRLRHPAAGGVILFAHNFESPEQLLALTGEIAGLAAASVDAILHDPPRFGIAGELYSQAFYDQLARVLKAHQLVLAESEPGEKQEEAESKAS